jgi:hypothetical protein
VAYELELPKKLKAERWKVKIRDRERSEPPHVTILHKTRAWRIGLRSGSFLDREPPAGTFRKSLSPSSWLTSRT